MELGPYLLGPNDTQTNGIYTGDARELAKAIPDESVDLIFTDLVYDRIDDYRWLAEAAARVLKSGAFLFALSGGYYFEQIFDVMRQYLQFYWLNAVYMRSVSNIGTIWPKSISVRWKPVLWFSKGSGGKHKFVSDGISYSVADKRFHGWGQSEQWCWYWLQELTNDEMFILEPFTGGGTVPAVCKMLGRRYLAFEIDPDTAEIARKRVRETQPPLFVPQNEQISLALG